jgi:malate dehydrogenase (oxaloacetate-decarboxylating)
VAMLDSKGLVVDAQDEYRRDLAWPAELAAQLPEEDLRAGSLFPRISGLRAITARVAEAVVRQAVSDGVARNPPENPTEAVATAMWDPAYPAIDVA